MARPLEFDKSEALDAALNLFWREGYESSTIQKLLVEMGINRGSLYSSFGDKETLFLSALERYEAMLKVNVVATLEAADDPLQAIRAFFESRFIDADKRTLENGCLLFNTISELSNTLPELAAVAGKKLQVVERALLKRLQEAEKRKQLRSGRTAAELRDYLMAMQAGLGLRGKQRSTRKQLRATLDHALATL